MSCLTPFLDNSVLFLFSEWVSVERSLRLIRVEGEEVVEEILGLLSLAAGGLKETARRE
jgi:hypothetical protein